MLDEKTRALLGDREAQEDFTERGELLPCHCGGIAKMLCFEKRGVPFGDMGYLAEIKCPECWAELHRWALKKEWAKEGATKAWNTRALLLTPTHMELLERESRKFEEELK